MTDPGATMIVANHVETILKALPTVPPGAFRDRLERQLATATAILRRQADDQN